MDQHTQDIAGVIADQLDRLFARKVNRESLVNAERTGLDTALWAELGEIGVGSLLAAETAGGAGVAWRQSGEVLRLVGRHLPPVPIGETMLAAWVLGRAGHTLAFTPTAVIAAPLRIDADGNIEGEDELVSWAPAARQFVALVRSTRGDEIVVLDAGDLQLRPQRTLDRLPAARVICRGVKPVLRIATAAYGESGLRAPLAVLRAQQIAGSLAQVLSLCVDHANTRSQFGRTIGKFQAIQHQLAELAEMTAESQVAADYASRQLDSGVPGLMERGAAIAKSRAGIGASRGAAIAHQVFGAIGITDEHSLHHYTRRLWQWREEAGSDRQWSEWLGARVIAAGGMALWPDIVE